MTDHPGEMWALVQEWLDTFRYKPPSQRDLAKALQVSNSSLSDYKYGRSMPPPVFVVRLSAEMQVPYERVLDAVLKDRGYRGEKLAYAEAQAVREGRASGAQARPALPPREQGAGRRDAG